MGEYSKTEEICVMAKTLVEMTFIKRKLTNLNQVTSFGRRTRAEKQDRYNGDGDASEATGPRIRRASQTYSQLDNRFIYAAQKLN